VKDETLEAAKERAWREVAAVDEAYASGDLGDDGWHRAMANLVVPAYLSAATPQGGSGHSGTSEDWDWSRGVVADAIDRDGAFLDVGCANGLLLESVQTWAAERGFSIEPYGLDISPELAALARARYPHWGKRIFVGNALVWSPPLRFDVVRTNLDYVPKPRRLELLRHLLDEVVSPGGRIVVGKFNEEAGEAALEAEVCSWGFNVSGRAERSHRLDQRIAYRVFWIDAR
jgi:2-polyprenyl-3-methyl-5-hydroxy-6-metoxy-1,4-benzoquinol methylase